MTSLNELAKRIHLNSSKHGFWPEGGRNFGEMLMLAVSELAEALEEHRDGNPPRYYQFRMDANTPDYERALVNQAGEDNRAGLSVPDEVIEHLVKMGIAKPEGVAVELIDCIIRCLDTLHSLEVDIDQIMKEKMQYNAGRPFRHGKAY